MLNNVKKDKSEIFKKILKLNDKLIDIKINSPYDYNKISLARHTLNFHIKKALSNKNQTSGPSTPSI